MTTPQTPEDALRQASALQPDARLAATSAADFARYEHSLVESWRRLAALDPLGEVIDDGAAVTMVHSHPALCNALLRLPSGLPRVQATYAGHHAVWVRDGNDAAAHAVAQRGYRPDEWTEPMLLDLTTWEPRRHSLEIRPAALADIAEWSGVDQQMLDGLPKTCGWATAEGESWALAITTGDAVNVSFVSTRAEHQRRGLATAVLTHLLADAQARGSRYAALQSTPAGRPLYLRLGFVGVGRWQEWVPAEGEAPNR